MKIGLQTVRATIGATLATVIVEELGLFCIPPTRIISVLGVTSTKKTSIMTGIYRLLSLALATILTYICSTFLGFIAVTSGTLLLLFISAAVYSQLSDGVAMSSVLVTHYLIGKNLSWVIIGNESLSMSTGAGLALSANPYMPDIKKRLRGDQEVTETIFCKILREMVLHLNSIAGERDLVIHCADSRTLIRTGETWAKNHAENQLLFTNTYYLEYFTMRKMQSNILENMLELLEGITADT